MKNSRKILSAVLIAAAAICLIAAIALTAQRFTDTMQTRNTMDELRTSTEPLPPESSSEPEESPSPSPVPESTPEPVETPTPTPSPVVNPYLDSFLANDDMAAWLQIPGTDIDYPVMWTPRDEEYYLRRGFDGARNQNGCLILDTDSCLDPLTTNLIIHGHNMRSGTMFGTLEDYEDEAYC